MILFAETALVLKNPGAAGPGRNKTADSYLANSLSLPSARIDGDWMPASAFLPPLSALQSNGRTEDGSVWLYSNMYALAA